MIPPFSFKLAQRVFNNRCFTLWTLINLLLLIVLPAATFSANLEQTKGNTMMDNIKIEALLQSALQAQGEEYLKHRSTLLIESETNPAVLNSAKSILAQSQDWQRQLLFQVINGWATRPALFEQCTKFMRGDLVGRKPLAGFTVRQRAHAMAELGPSVVIRIMEMLWKSVEYSAGTEESSLYVALELLKDPQAEKLMLHLSDPGEPENTQMLALSVLIRTEKFEYYPLVFEIAQDTKRANAVRNYAIVSLGELRDDQALPTLIDILKDEHSSKAEQLAAAEGIAARQDPSSRSVVVEALNNNDDEDILLVLVGILSDIGVKDDIPHLLHAGHKHKTVKEYAKDAIEEINDREDEARL